MSLQELGRFPDLGAFTAPAPSARGSDDRASRASPARSPGETPSARWASTPVASRDASTTHAHGEQDAPPPQHPGNDPAQLVREAGVSSRTDGAAVSAADVAVELPDAGAAQTQGAGDSASPSRASRGAAALTESRESALADISDACSEDVMTHSRQAAASSAAAGDIVRGGELGPDDSSPTLEQSA